MTQVEPVDPFHGTEQNLRFSLTMYWDTNTLEWVKGTQGSGGGGGDASAANQVTGNTSLSSIDGKVATAAKQDTAQTSFGATTDAEATGDGSIIAILKRLRTLLSGTLTVGSHAVTNAGTFAVQESGAALTSLQLLDDTVVAEDAAHSSGDKGIMALAVRNDVGTARSGTDGDYTPISVDSQGRVTTQSGLATVVSSTNFTRPADTTAYASGDVVCNSTSAPTILTFTGMAKVAGRGGMITAASLVLGSNPSTKPVFDLLLFDTTVTMDNDNAAFTPTDTELATCVAVIPFAVATVGDASSNCVYTADVQKAYLTAGSTSLFGILVARNAITPTSADTYTLRLTAALD